MIEEVKKEGEKFNNIKENPLMNTINSIRKEKHEIRGRLEIQGFPHL